MMLDYAQNVQEKPTTPRTYKRYMDNPHIVWNREKYPCRPKDERS